MKNVFIDFPVGGEQWAYPAMELRFRDCLAGCGWSVSDAESADLHFRDSNLIKSDITRPTIVFYRCDTSWPLGGSLALDEQDNVVGFCTPIMTTGPLSCISNFVDAKRKLTKPVFCFTTMLWHQLDVQKCYHNITPVERVWDVSFVGTMHHGGTFVKKHRANLRRAWGTLDEFCSVAMFEANVIHGYIIPWDQTWKKVIKRSRTVVSPWGTCEISWRDYEAALGGCMMIKPRQPEIKVTCTPWHEENVIYCEPDYSDLADRVRESLEVDRAPLERISRKTLAAGLDFNVLAKALAEILDACST